MESFLCGHELFVMACKLLSMGNFCFFRRQIKKKNESTGNSEINSINFYLAFCCHVNLDHNVTLFLDLHQTFQKIPLLGGM